jgi:hypothetical protein
MTLKDRIKELAGIEPELDEKRRVDFYEVIDETEIIIESLPVPAENKNEIKERILSIVRYICG